MYAQCRPLIWRSISFEAEVGGVRPASWVEKRSLRRLSEIMRESRLVGTGQQRDTASVGLGDERDKDTKRTTNPLPIKAFSYISPRIPWRFSSWDPEPELQALLDVLLLLRNSPIQVIFLRGIEAESRTLSLSILAALLELDTLSALRLNQVDLAGRLDTVLQRSSQRPNIRTLQIMHGSPQLVDLVRVAPNLESLLMWPSSRRYRELGTVILDRLPRLRMLSLDSVHEPSLFNKLSASIEVRLTRLQIHGSLT